MTTRDINPIDIDRMYDELVSIYGYNLSCKRHEDKIVPALWGPSGIGKTEVVKQAATSIDFVTQVLGLSSLNPVDVGGFPYRDGDKARQAKPFYFPDEGKKVNLFLDEINTAPVINQITAFSLTLNGSIQDHILPMSTLITVAGNGAKHNSAVTKTPKPLDNRLTHYDVQTSIKSFVKFAVTVGIHPDIIGYLLYKPTSLLTEFPKPEERAFPTPRSWHKVSNLLNAGITSRATLSGTIGLGAFTELTAYAKLHKALPDLDMALSDPSSITIPTQRDIMYLMVNGLVQKLLNKPSLDPIKVSNFFQLVDMLPVEMRVIALHSAVAHPKGHLLASGVFSGKIQEILNGKV